jgi:hypothetical protein
MRQRGRKSAASLSVIAVDGRPSRLESPRYLNKIEKAVFTELAATVISCRPMRRCSRP